MQPTRISHFGVPRIIKNDEETQLTLHLFIQLRNILASCENVINSYSSLEAAWFRPAYKGNICILRWHEEKIPPLTRLDYVNQPAIAKGDPCSCCITDDEGTWVSSLYTNNARHKTNWLTLFEKSAAVTLSQKRLKRKIRSPNV